MIIKQITKTKFEIECDNCNKIIQRYKSQATGDTHFCSKECVKIAKLSGGKIAEKIKKTNLEKYGCENVFASKIIKDKIKSTLVEKYGVDNPQKSEKIRQRSQETCIKKYGVDNPAKSQLVREKESLTHKSKSVEEKEAALEKRKITNLKKYGVEFPMQIESVKEKFDWSNAYKKSIETKRKNKTGTSSSKIEYLVMDILHDIFGKDEVQSQVTINNRWTVDFYIKSRDLYLQVDGVYWHGLDRSLDDIQEFKSSKDVRILQTFNKDREQDLWAKTNNVKLLRITDEEIITWQKKKELLEMIQHRINQEATATILQQI